MLSAGSSHSQLTPEQPSAYTPSLPSWCVSEREYTMTGSVETLCTAYLEVTWYLFIVFGISTSIWHLFCVYSFHNQLEHIITIASHQYGVSMSLNKLGLKLVLNCKSRWWIVMDWTPENDNSVIIYSASNCPKPVCILKDVGNRTADGLHCLP